MHRRKIKNRRDAESCLMAAAAKGQTRAEWARDNGVDARSLNCWRLAIDGNRVATPLRMLELISAAPAPASYTVRCGAFEVDAPSDFDDAVLGRLQGDLELGVLHSAMANFRTGWLTLDVQQNRLSATVTDEAHFVALRDFIVGVLTLLEHTPITACGINRHMHFNVATTDQWHAIGNRLLPKAHFHGLMEEPGMADVTVKGRRPGCTSSMQMMIQPSTLVRPGVFFALNEHYANPTVTSAASARDALSNNWDPVMAHFLTSATTVLQRARGAS